MGIHDRDYMREEPEYDWSDPLVKILKLVLLALLLFFSLRFPLPLFVKAPLLVGLCFLSFRVITKV